jgi:DNA-binding CsgD family transcriptional regulator
MKHDCPNPIVTHGICAFHLDPTLTGEEAMVLRALAGGHTDRRVCKELSMDPTAFLRLMRGMRAKIGTFDDVSLIAWAKLQIRGVERRIDRPERYARLA